MTPSYTGAKVRQKLHPVHPINLAAGDAVARQIIFAPTFIDWRWAKVKPRSDNALQPVGRPLICCIMGNQPALALWGYSSVGRALRSQ